VDKLQSFEWNFGSAVISSPPTVVHLLIENTGDIEVDWCFTFLSKLEVKKEKWVDLGERNEAEKEQAFIVENKIFSLSPESGQLQPGRYNDVNSC
jgi:hypothetical protein